MLLIPGYQISAQIYESANSLVYRGIQDKTGKPVIVKILKEDYPTTDDIRRYKQEYQITKLTEKIPGTVKVITLEKYQNQLAIIFEYFEGKSIRDFLKIKKFNLSEFLQIAIQCAEILGEIHATNIIHKDINPANILFHAETGQIKIIDFGISTVFSRETPTLKNPNVLEGTIAYMSPEQTGRMNRALDYRTDFYSLGVTFYEILTQKLPFDSEDAMELVHCHIAKQPIPPHHLNSEIPQAISDIVMKMLAKTPEQRYQSAWGIQGDLVISLMQLEANGQIEDIVPGSNDISDKFQIPEKLYGREREVEKLLAAFDRVAAQHPGKMAITEKRKIAMMLVSGVPGIGKSSLVQEIYKPITAAKGYFIAGKFDQLQRNIPYSAVVAAFCDLVRQLLTEPEALLVKWREKLAAAFGTNGQIIIDVIPEVELIVGAQLPVQELGAAESQNRFNRVFQNFIRVFCDKEHPLVMFLDDLQWADLATLKLLELILTDDLTEYLFVIGAYRDNEVSSNHPLMMTVETLHQRGVAIDQINLYPLNLKQINQLIADTLHAELEDTLPLAKLVHSKTSGNPFFVSQFLNALYQEHLLTFDFQHLIWDWDVDQIEAMDITDNVVELTIAKLKKLPPATQAALSLAACIGNRFDANTLALVHEKSALETFRDLLPAIQEGLILPISELIDLEADILDSQLLILNFQFLHDRVQQAAYALLDEEDKPAAHLQIGRLLLANAADKERSEMIFEIADHLNLSRNAISDWQEKLNLAKLNLQAGIKAKKATAYAAALEYLTIGMDVLSCTMWSECYDLALSLHKELAEVEYLNGNFDGSKALIDMALAQAQSPIEKAELYNMLIIQCTLLGKFTDAIANGRLALSFLGIELPPSDEPADLSAEIHMIAEMLGDRPIASLLDAPQMIVTEPKIILKVLTNLQPAAYLSTKYLLDTIIIKMVKISLQYGNIPESSKAYCTYGVLLGYISGNYQDGYEFAVLGVKLSENFTDQALICKNCYIVGHFVYYWVKHIRQVIAVFDEGYQAGLESGELQYAGYILGHKQTTLFYQGKNLLQLWDDLPEVLAFSQKTKNQLAIEATKAIQLCILQLVGEADLSLDKLPPITEAEYLQKCQDSNSIFTMGTYRILQAQLLYLFDQPEAALSCLEAAENLLIFIKSTISIAQHNFYYSLVLANLYPTVSPSEQERYWQQLEANQQRMQIWAENAPDNCHHKYLLVAAEMARLSGDWEKAMDLYDAAIEAAGANEYPQEAGLANELAAKFWLAKGKEKFAKIYIRDAHYSYQVWGAFRKVEQLEELYPQWLARKIGGTITDTVTIVNNISYNSRSRALDLASVMKGSQAISSEIVLDKLLANLMQILIENAGAEKGVLIRENKGELVIEAEGVVDISGECVTKVLESIPLDSRLPQGIVYYVDRTKESLVINDATRESKFASDPYIQQRQPKSILCVPLINQGQLIGIVYLENNLTANAFTPDRLEIIKLLSSQAAISIENAKLYSELRASESRMAQFLEAVPVGLLVMDASGKLFYANQRAIEILGRRLAQSVSIGDLPQFYQIYYAGTNQPYPPEKLSIARALKGQRATTDDIEIRIGNKTIPIESWGTPIVDDRGNLVYAIAAFQDITERKKAEAERLRLTDDLLQLNAAYSRFVPRQFLYFLNKASIVDVKLGDQVQQEMSVLFSDIRSFTTLSESMTPEDNFRFINSYLSRMESAIVEHQGFIDKYIGDAIMALFGGTTPTTSNSGDLTPNNGADDALRAAIAMLHRLQEYNQHRITRGYIPIEIGIGINTGSLMLGTVGGHSRMDGTVISDAVNLASRLEGLTKNYHIPLVISHQTFLRLQNANTYAIRWVDRLTVKGKSQAVSVFEVFDADLPEVRDAKLATRTMFEEAVMLYCQGHFADALTLFQDCLRLNPRDTVASQYLQRIQPPVL
ncbi:MAG: AAA family ATPase [Oscillatoriaceae cyanobacterium]